jgi:hypothetical protein
VAENLTIKISADLAGLDAGIRETANKVTSLGDTLKGTFAGAFAADLASKALGGLTSVITDTVHALAEADRISGQTAAVIKSTGGAAGVSAAQIEALADQLERKTGIEAESIQKGQNLLLTFTNIKDAAGANNDIFTQTTKIMADLATAMGGDASGAAIQLGKALNDPTQGIAALTRVGVTFTDSQKEQIKALQASGDLMGAQRIVLAELRKEFGGSAEAAGKTFAGALDRVVNALGSIPEAMLTPAVPAFTAALGKAADAAYAVSDAITNGNIVGLVNDAFGPGTKALIIGMAAALTSSLVPSIGTVSAAATRMAATYTRAAASMVVANAPVLASFAAIAFAAYPFIKNWDKVRDLFGYLWQSMTNTVNNAMGAIGEASRNAWAIMSGHFKGAYANFVSFFVGPVARAFNTMFDALPQKVKDALGGLSFKMPSFSLDTSGISATFASVKQGTMDIVDTVKGGAAIAAEEFGKTWSSLPGEINRITGMFGASIANASKSAAQALGAVSGAAVSMGEKIKAAHDNGATASKEHKKKTEEVTLSLFEFDKKVFGLIWRINELRDKIHQAKLAKLAEQQQPLVDAKKKIDDLTSAAKYWGDATVTAADEMEILRSAIDDARSRGIDPANASLQAMRSRYDELKASQSGAILGAKDFSTAVSGIGNAITTLAGTMSFFGGGDSPVVGFLTKVADGIGLFNNWVTAVKGVQDAMSALGTIGFQNVINGISGLVAALGTVALPVTLIAAGIGLIIWAVHDAVKAFGGWPKVWDTLTLGWQKFSLGFAKVGEVIVGGVINFISAQWYLLVNGIKMGANLIIDAINLVIDGLNAMASAVPGGGPIIGRLNRFEIPEFELAKVDFSSKIEAEIAQTQARLDAAPAAKAWEISNPIAEISNAIKGAMQQAEPPAGYQEADKAFASIKMLEKKAAVFGDATDIAADKMRVLKDAMMGMVEAGTENTDSFRKLKSEYDMLKTATTSTAKTVADSTSAIAASASNADIAVKSLNAGQEDFLRGYNGLIQKALDAGNEVEARRLTTEKETKRREMLAEINSTPIATPAPAPRASSYRLQSLADDLRQPSSGAATPVTVNYYGNGKWTREDAQALGALIVNEIKTAGIR